MSSAKILIVDDEQSIVDLVTAYLRKEGYEVHTAMDGPVGLKAAHTLKPDLVVLDVMLPGMDGIELLTRLRRESDVYVIMLTARSEETDKIVGLSVGADDYLTKPFSMRELVARLKALLRRVRLIREELSIERVEPGAADAPGEILTFEDLTIDLTRREVTRQGELLHLKPKEYELLVFLARNRGIVLSRDLILERVWGWDYDGGSRTVDVHVRWLREKIESDPANPTRIVTVRSIGYRFEG